MSDQGPIDPARAERPVGGDPAGEDPTSVLRPAGEPRVTSETTWQTTTRPGVPPTPPGGGVSTGVAVGAAVAAALLGLLFGLLLFGSDDDDDVATDAATTVPAEDGTDEFSAEREELFGQIEDQNARIKDLEAELEEVTAVRDELESQVEEGDDEEVVTVPAPDVVGGTVEDAQAVADENGWTLEVRAAENPPDDAEPGTVVAQSPEPGTPMVEGSVLLVDVVEEQQNS
jgi:hypothetical protein